MCYLKTAYVEKYLFNRFYVCLEIESHKGKVHKSLEAVKKRKFTSNTLIAM